jgi:sensor domain CHASE-containing protein
MDPSNIIVWALCLGVAWLVFASMTGADDWLKSLFSKGEKQDLEDRVVAAEERADDLENRVATMEKRLDEISKK